MFAARRTRLRRRRPGTSDGVGSHAQPSAGGSGRQGVGGSVDGQARATASPATLSHPRAAAARLVAVQLTILITVQLTVLVAVIQLAVHQPGRVARGPAHSQGPLRGRGRVTFSTRPLLRGRGQGEKSGVGGGGVLAQPAPDPPRCQPYSHPLFTYQRRLLLRYPPAARPAGSRSPSSQASEQRRRR